MQPRALRPRAQIAAWLLMAFFGWFTTVVFGVSLLEVDSGTAGVAAVAVMLPVSTCIAVVTAIRSFRIAVIPEPGGLRIQNLVRTIEIPWDSVVGIGSYTAYGIRSGTYSGPAIEYADADGQLRELRLWHLAGHVLAARPAKMIERLNRMVAQGRDRRAHSGGLIADDIVSPGD